MLEHPQLASSFLMVAPNTFGYDYATARSNAFQQPPSQSTGEMRLKAMREFDGYVDTLVSCGVDVVTYNDPDPYGPAKPDAVFSNNWLTTWPDGTIYTYPMATESRRLERSETVIDTLRGQFDVTNVVELWQGNELSGNMHALEGTGAMVFDHTNKVAYGGKSLRCDEGLLTDHVENDLGYKSVIFHASDKTGLPIYHTNVMLGVQSRTAVVCGKSITDDAQRKDVFTTLEQGGKRIIDITREQVASFCGNVLNIKNRYGQPFVVLSDTAYRAFTPRQLSVLDESGRLLPVNIKTIETVGGGSARCMLTEIFLPRAEQPGV